MTIDVGVRGAEDRKKKARSLCWSTVGARVSTAQRQSQNPSTYKKLLVPPELRIQLGDP